MWRTEVRSIGQSQFARTADVLQVFDPSFVQVDVVLRCTNFEFVFRLIGCIGCEQHDVGSDWGIGADLICLRRSVPFFSDVLGQKLLNELQAARVVERMNHSFLSSICMRN